MKRQIKALAIIATILWAGMFGTPFLYGEPSFKWNKTIGFRDKALELNATISLPHAPFVSLAKVEPQPPKNFDDWNGIGMIRPVQLISICNDNYKVIKNYQIDKFNRSKYNRFKAKR